MITIFLSLSLIGKFPTNWLSFNLFQNLALTNVLYISNCPEQAIFLLNLKTKLNFLLSIVLEQLNHESFSKREKSFHSSIKMCLPFNKVWLYANTCAAVIAGTWAAHLCVWRKVSINMFLILSEESNNQQKFYQSKIVKTDL